MTGLPKTAFVILGGVSGSFFSSVDFWVEGGATRTWPPPLTGLPKTAFVIGGANGVFFSPIGVSADCGGTKTGPTLASWPYVERAERPRTAKSKVIFFINQPRYG